MSPASLEGNSPRREFTSHRCCVRATPLEVSRHRPPFRRHPLESTRRLTAFTRRTTALRSRRPGVDARRMTLRSPPTLAPRSTPGRNPHFNVGGRDDRGSDERCSPRFRPRPMLRPRDLVDHSPRTAENRLIPVQPERCTKQTPHQPAARRQRTEVSATSVAERQQRTELRERTTELRERTTELTERTTELTELRRRCDVVGNVMR